MPDLSSGNKEALQRIYLDEKAKREREKEASEHAKATLDQIAEEQRARATACGITVDEYRMLIRLGQRGTEAIECLESGRASTVEQALHTVWNDAGDDAGKIIDQIGAAFGKRSHGGRDLISEIIHDEDEAHPHRRRHKTTKAYLAASAQWERDQIEDLRKFLQETMEADTDDGG